MTKPISIASIEKATGKNWDEWLKFFASIGAQNLSHKEIAEKVHAAGTPGWWAQNVTVAYEQHIGRRVPGQENDGTFTVNVSKTVDGSMDQSLARWQKLADKYVAFCDAAVVGEPKISKTEKWRNWRCNLDDGTRVVVGITEKPGSKAVLGLAHEKIPTAEKAQDHRTYWKELLTEF